MPSFFARGCDPPAKSVSCRVRAATHGANEPITLQPLMVMLDISFSPLRKLGTSSSSRADTASDFGGRVTKSVRQVVGSLRFAETNQRE
jgi:hypothetical protein